MNVLAERLPLLQEVIVSSCQISMERSTVVEDEAGAVLEELGNGAEAPSGTYVKLWSGLSTALDNRKAVASMLANIVQQVKTMTAAMDQVTSRANKASTDKRF
jgi:hypothetical protein